MPADHKVDVAGMVRECDNTLEEVVQSDNHSVYGDML